MFRDNLNQFRTAWTFYCERKSQKKIHSNKIVDFFRNLGPPLGISNKANFVEAGKKIMKMNIPW